jgi:hypothetical protein
MDLSPYIEGLQRQLVVAAAAGGDEARALGERLIAPLEAAARLALLEVLGSAAEEITCDLAPGSVELRLRRGEPEFAVTAPPVDPPDETVPSLGSDTARAPAGPVAGDEGGMSRVNLRMPDHLKARVEHAAGREGLSVNAWLVRAAAAALDRADPGRPPERRAPMGARRYTGWAR